MKHDGGKFHMTPEFPGKRTRKESVCRGRKTRRVLLCMLVLLAALMGLCGCAGETLPQRDLPETTAERTVPTQTAATEATTEPVTEAATVPATEPSTEPTTEPTTEPATEPSTEPVTEPTTEPATEPSTEPTTEPTTVPATEPAAVPERSPATEENCDYILNTNTHKFHYPDCGSAKKIKDKNKEYFCGTRDELIARGFDPCGNCDP